MLPTAARVALPLVAMTLSGLPIATPMHSLRAARAQCHRAVRVVPWAVAATAR